MIDQGRKGYCAAATLARVLRFYGYPVDQHAMAELARTEGQMSSVDRGGTRLSDVLDAMRRVCNSTPFRLRRIDIERPGDLLPVIRRGLPVIWIVPGHARLLIGMNPDNNEIVYSDSWGEAHRLKVGSWELFHNLHRGSWILEPRGD